MALVHLYRPNIESPILPDFLDFSSCCFCSVTSGLKTVLGISSEADLSSVGAGCGSLLLASCRWSTKDSSAVAMRLSSWVSRSVLLDLQEREVKKLRAVWTKARMPARATKPRRNPTGDEISGIYPHLALQGSLVLRPEIGQEIAERAASVDRQSVLLQSHFLAFARSHCLISEVPLPLFAPMPQSKTRARYDRKWSKQDRLSVFL